VIATSEVRDKIADYVQALVTVYWIIILAYVLLSWIEMFGGRIPYSRTTSAIIGFIREAAEPYLRLFRRILPSFGGLDLSPMVALIVLWIVSGFVIRLIDNYA
jgi:uncharacterized protein YggT (Ycf19 family)